MGLFHLQSWVKINIKRIYEDQIGLHLLICLKSGYFNELPLSKPGRKVIKKIYFFFDVFCNCRFPWVWCHSKNKDLNMAQCDSYKTGII